MPRPTKRLRSNPDLKNSIGKKERYVSKAISTRKLLELIGKILPLSDEQSQAGSAQFRLVDFSLLLPFLQANLRCKCGSEVTFNETSIRGLGFTIELECENCSTSASVTSCKMIGPKKNLYESNRKSIFGIRSLGLGLTSLKTFRAIMDLPPPVGQKTYDTMKDCLGLATRKVAEDSMCSAVEKEIQLTKHRELTVSGDGTWRTPDFHSHQGAATVIGLNTGKVLDVATKNNFCKACSLWENKDKETGAYDDWLEQHKPFCEANHTDSSGSMEVDCISDIFKRSVEKYKVIYKNYIGDGDAKVYKRICEDEPYGEDFQIEKKEDINHVSKRMGKRLRDKKKELSRTHLSDGKTIGGKGKLTGAAIDMLSKYYGKAVRDSSTVEEMYNAIWATWKH
ncbi:hypothetical protein TKK_0010242 [Trichogramma kaykai]